MLAIHRQARATPAVGAQIASSFESSGVLARRYGVSAKTRCKWRRQGPSNCQALSARPHKLSCVPAMRSAPSCARSAAPPIFPLDDLTFIISHLPHHT
jgi:hypothetical protein